MFIPEILLLLKRPENSSSPPLAHRPGGFVYLPDGFCSHLATHSSPNQTEPPAQDHVPRSLTHTQLSVPHYIKTGAGLLLTGGLATGESFQCVEHQFHHLSQEETILPSLRRGLLC